MFYQVLSMLLGFGLFMFGYYFEHKMEKRKEYEGWVLDERIRFLAIAAGYEIYCQDLYERCFKENTALLRRCNRFGFSEMYIRIMNSRITEFEEAVKAARIDYDENLDKKYGPKYGPGFCWEAFPKYLLLEYSDKLYSIENRFLCLARLMGGQIQTLSSPQSIE